MQLKNRLELENKLSDFYFDEKVNIRMTVDDIVRIFERDTLAKEWQIARNTLNKFKIRDI